MVLLRSEQQKARTSHDRKEHGEDNGSKANKYNNDEDDNYDDKQQSATHFDILTAGTDHTFPEQFYLTAKCSTMKSLTSTTKKNEKHHTTARSKERTGAHGDKHSSHQLHTYHHGTFTEYQHLTIEALRCKKQQTPELHKTNWIISGHSAITTIHRDQ
jgi:hypothetical protein